MSARYQCRLCGAWLDRAENGMSTHPECREIARRIAADENGRTLLRDGILNNDPARQRRIITYAERAAARLPLFDRRA